MAWASGRVGGCHERDSAEQQEWKTMSELAWQEHARCAGAGLELFFPDGGDTRRAKAFCAGCPVWSECLAYGLEEDHGVWGGLNRAERARLRRLRHRLVVAPADPANAVDIRRLLAVGLAPERLSELAGLGVDTIRDTAKRTGRRRDRDRDRVVVRV
jgi:WhiB family redox-sensing transcriptional regulator